MRALRTGQQPLTVNAPTERTRMGRLAGPSWTARRGTVNLTIYRGTTRAQKRAVLHSFWTRSSQPDDVVARAAAEYGTWAIALLAVTVVELAVIAVALLARHQRAWAECASVVTLFTLWSTWWAYQCRRSAHHFVALTGLRVMMPDDRS